MRKSKFHLKISIYFSALFAVWSFSPFLLTSNYSRKFKQKVLFFSLFLTFIVLYISLIQKSTLILAQTPGCENCEGSCTEGIVCINEWYCNEIGWLCNKFADRTCYGTKNVYQH